MFQNTINYQYLIFYNNVHIFKMIQMKMSKVCFLFSVVGNPTTVEEILL